MCIVMLIVPYFVSKAIHKLEKHAKTMANLQSMVVITNIECRYHADTVPIADISVSAYRQSFFVADTDTADTEKCADMPIFPIPIPVSAHP